MIKGLVFDLDGVITETAELHYRAWKNEVKKIGIDYSEKVNAQFKGLPRIDTLKKILEHYNITHLSEEEINEISTAKNNLYKEMLKTELTQENILPGINQLLEDAQKRSLKMAIASSSHNAPAILLKLNLLNYFEYIVDPSKLTHGKPDPEIFLKATKGLGLSVDEVIGFEDAIPGVIALKKANIKTLAVTWGDKGNWNMADIVVESTKNIKLKDILD